MYYMVKNQFAVYNSIFPLKCIGFVTFKQMSNKYIEFNEWCVDVWVYWEVCWRGVCHIYFHVYFQFILVVAFILDVGRVIFGREVYKIKGFLCTMVWLIYLIKCCMVKLLDFISFPNSTIRLSNSDLFIDCTDSLYIYIYIYIYIFI